MIEIIFKRTPVILPVLLFSCPNPTGGPTVMTNEAGNAMAASMIPAFPQRVKFEAKEGMQFIEQLGGPGQELFYQAVVRQLKDD